MVRDSEGQGQNGREPAGPDQGESVCTEGAQGRNRADPLPNRLGSRHRVRPVVCDDNRPPRPQITLRQGRAHRPQDARRSLPEPRRGGRARYDHRSHPRGEVRQLAGRCPADDHRGGTIRRGSSSESSFAMLVRGGSVSCVVGAHNAPQAQQGRWQGSEQRDTHRCARKAADGRQDSHLGGPQDV